MPLHPQSSSSARLSSQEPSSKLVLQTLNSQCPEGYEIYMEEEDAQKDYEKIMGKNDEVSPVHVASPASMRKWICQDHCVNSKGRNEGGYPTGEAPTPRLDPVLEKFEGIDTKRNWGGLKLRMQTSRGKNGKMVEKEDLMLSKFQSEIQADTRGAKTMCKDSYFGPVELDDSKHSFLMACNCRCRRLGRNVGTSFPPVLWSLLRQFYDLSGDQRNNK